MLVMGESQEREPANQNPSATEVRVDEFEDAYHMGAKLACFGKPVVRDDAKKKREKPGDAGVLESRRQGSDQW